MSILAATPAVFATIALLAHVISHGLSLRYLQWERKRTGRTEWPEVSLIRPLCGLEPFSLETAEASFRLTYPSYELVFCVARPDDPIIPIVEDAIARHRHVRARLLVGAVGHSGNPKLDNMATGLFATKGEIVVFTDSNLLIPADYLERVIFAFDDETAVVSAPPFGSHPASFWADVECALLNSYAARIQYCVDALGFGFAQGKTLAFRRADLEAGAFAALGNEPAEDAAATKWARSIGKKVRLITPAFPQPLGHRDFGAVWSRHLRWARLRRATFLPLFVPELLSSAILPFIAVALVAGDAGGSALPWLIGYITVWYAFDFMAARRLGWPSSARSLVALPIRDCLLVAIWAAAWLRRDFVWRGNQQSARPRKPIKLETSL